MCLTKWLGQSSFRFALEFIIELAYFIAYYSASSVEKMVVSTKFERYWEKLGYGCYFR